MPKRWHAFVRALDAGRRSCWEALIINDGGGGEKQSARAETTQNAPAEEVEAPATFAYLRGVADLDAAASEVKLAAEAEAEAERVRKRRLRRANAHATVAALGAAAELRQARNAVARARLEALRGRAEAVSDSTRRSPAVSSSWSGSCSARSPRPALTSRKRSL